MAINLSYDWSVIKSSHYRPSTWTGKSFFHTHGVTLRSSTPNWRKVVQKSINHKRYDPIAFWENRHSLLVAFTWWLFVLKYVHKEYILNTPYFQHVLYKFKIQANGSCYVFFHIWQKAFVLRFQERVSNYVQNQSTKLTVNIPTWRNNLYNDNEFFSPQDASCSYRLWFGVDNVFFN
jgi:hypothetical protein